MVRKGFGPMTRGLGRKFGVVFSFAVVATDTELGVKVIENRKKRALLIYILTATRTFYLFSLLSLEYSISRTFHV